MAAVDEVAREQVAEVNRRINKVETKQDSFNEDLGEIRTTLAGLAPWVKAGSIAATGIVTTLVILAVERAIL